MEVYVAQREYDYEGFEIIGVFLTENEAKDCCDGDTFSDGREYGDSHDVQEFEIGKNLNNRAKLQMAISSQIVTRRQKSMFEKWWEDHMMYAGCDKAVAKSIYESAILDAADWIEPQRNDIPCDGESFASALRQAI